MTARRGLDAAADRREGRDVKAGLAGATQSVLSPRLKDVADGLYLQMYYWGRDVLHPAGNLLVEHGFRRIAKEGAHGTSRYQRELAGGLLELHGHLAGWYPGAGDEPGVIFVRQRRTCQLCGESEPVLPGQLETARIWTPSGSDEWAQLATVTRTLLQWLGEYESWISSHLGVCHRAAQYREYQMLPKKNWWLPPAPAQRWFASFVADPVAVPRARAWQRGLRDVNS